MQRVVVLAAVLVVAGCGGTRATPEHATLTDVTVGTKSVAFDFDSAPQEIRHAYAARASLAECGSGAAVRPKGSAFLVVHFQPAQTNGVPKRIIMAAGTVLEVSKVCDFEADVAWAIGVSRRLPVHVSRDGSSVTVSFGD